MSKSKKPIQLSNDRNIHLRTTVPSHQEQLVHIGKAISSPVRLQILNLLDNTPMSIQDVYKRQDLPLTSSVAMLLVATAAPQPKVLNFTSRMIWFSSISR